MKITAARVLALAVASPILLAASLAAQTPPQTSFTLTLPNYNTIPIGQVGGLEGGAFIARTNDASSNWYNPAGLALAKTSSVSSSAGTYQLLSLVPKELQSEDSGGSTQQVPALVGIVIKKPFGDDHYTAGIASSSSSTPPSPRATRATTCCGPNANRRSSSTTDWAARPWSSVLPWRLSRPNARAIVNIAFGGYYALTQNEVWKLHFGFNTHFSPVGNDDQFFSKVDLYGLTLGISGETRHFVASLGMNYSFGNANNAPLAELLNSDISVNAIAIIYSLAYRF